MGILYFFIIFQFPMLFNGNSTVMSFFSIFHVIQWEFYVFVNFLSIFYAIQWKLLHFFINHQFFIIFNGNPISFHYLSISHIIQWEFYIFFMLSIFHIIQWCNGALKPNWAEVPLCSTGHLPLLTITYIHKHTKQGNGNR